MKLRYVAASLAIFAAFWVASRAHAQVEFKTDDAVEYSNHIVEEQEKLGKVLIEFSMQLVGTSDYKANEARRIEVVKKIELGLRRLRNMAPFKGGTALRDEAIEVFDLYKKLHTEEYSKIAMLVSNKESSLEKLEEYFQLQVVAEKQLIDYSKRMKKAQHDFAMKHRLTLVGNPMQSQFDRILKTNIYCREVFLGYLAVGKVNERWWTAMQKNDMEGMKTERQNLKDAVAASKVAAMDGLDGNTTFRDAAQARIAYFGELAENDYKTIREFLENPMRTQEDVDKVNSLIDGYNEKNSALNQRFNEANRSLKMKSLNGG